jgi:hypothetical protein
MERVKIPGTHYKISSKDHEATLGACRSDRNQVIFLRTSHKPMEEAYFIMSSKYRFLLHTYYT